MFTVLGNPGKHYVCELPPKIHLEKLKIGNHNKLIIGQLNINSIRYKFECLKYIIDNNVDILLILQTKLNNTFRIGQFLMNSFHLPFTKDRTEKGWVCGVGGGGEFYYTYVNMYLAEVKVTLELNIEAIFVEINLRKIKWILIDGYNPGKAKICTFLNCIGSKLTSYAQNRKTIILMGDLNSEMSEERMNFFCNTYNFKCLVKSIDNPSCVDLVLTNKSLCFQHTTLVETGLSDFHHYNEI